MFVTSIFNILDIAQNTYLKNKNYTFKDLQLLNKST